MKYEFFKETLVSKFIRYLLQRTPLPQYTYIQDNQYMIKDCLYTYRDKILLCTSSGIFIGLRGGEIVEDHLTVSDDLKVNDPFNISGSGEDNRFMNNTSSPEAQSYYNVDTASSWMTIYKDGKDETIPIAVTDDLVRTQYYPTAKFKIVDTYLSKNMKPNITQTSVSTESFYGPETHHMLGEYLRFLKNVKGIDLMSQYNCFGQNVVRNLSINPKNENIVSEIDSGNFKVLLVPIKFNCNYTIAIDSKFKVSMHPVFYREGNLLKDKRNQYYLYQDLLSHLKNVTNQDSLLLVHNTMEFNNPIVYNIRNFDKNLVQYEKYLYLAIQINSTNDSSIVVLEGDYRNNKARVVSDVSVLTKPGATIERLSDAMSSNLSLLSENDHKQHPFTDMLVEYLCGNTIDSRELLTKNVERVVEKLGNFHYGYEGQWTDYLRFVLYNRMHDYEEDSLQHFDDVLGYVDSNTENVLERGHMKYGS